MIQRSQNHKEQVHGYRPPAITGILPDTASIAAAGAVGRTIATLSANGGTPPIAYTITSAGGLSAVIVGTQLNTSVNPCGTVGAKTVVITATDRWAQSRTENLIVTVT
jgi:Asp/Glu/hydantoin racemase